MGGIRKGILKKQVFLSFCKMEHFLSTSEQRLRLAVPYLSETCYILHTSACANTACITYLLTLLFGNSHATRARMQNCKDNVYDEKNL